MNRDISVFFKIEYVKKRRTSNVWGDRLSFITFGYGKADINTLGRHKLNLHPHCVRTNSLNILRL